MSLDSLLQEIEGHDFSARINIASGFRTALRGLTEETAVIDLRRSIQQPEMAHRLLWRILDITRRSVDVRYENPYDTALLVYALVLLENDHRLAFIAASAISQLPNLWWSGELATAILADRVHLNNDAGVTRLQFPSPGRAGPEVAFELQALPDAGDRVFVSDVRGVVGNTAIQFKSVIALSVIEFTADSQVTTLEVAGHPLNQSEASGDTRDSIVDLATR